MKVKKVGRPPLPRRQRKAERLEIRLSTAELKVLDQIARDNELSRGGLIRHLIGLETKRKGRREGA